MSAAYYVLMARMDEETRAKYSKREPTIEELCSPEVLRLAAKIRRQIERREAPVMEALERATRLTAEDYATFINT